MLYPGTILGERYEIIESIGTGGMSDVYKAKCHKLNRFVAVKVLKSDFSQDADFRKKFATEAQAAAGLSHPNIVSVYDVGEENGIYYIVMELVTGITLKEHIGQEGRIEWRQAVDFTTQIARALEVAHRNNTIHRDIKPQNIIVSEDGVLKVTDFGIAKAASSNTVATTAAGSVHYISPEQARGGYCDQKSDIYSLGITLYEMVTGRVPFDGESNVTVALQHIQDELVRPSKYVSDIPFALEQVIIKCTQKRAERRYLSATALIMDLRKVLLDPNGNFVNIAPLVDDAQTVIMSANDVNKIKNTPTRDDDLEEQDYDDDVEDVEEDDSDDYEEEQEDGEGMDPKLEKLVRVLGYVAAVLVVMFIIFLAGKAMNLKLFSGKPKPEATTEAVTTEVPIADIPVPKVVGKNIDDATRELKALGLEVLPVPVQSDEPEDTVIEQDKLPGEMAAKGDVITLKISDKKTDIPVPDVKDYSESEARAKLQGLGFTVSRQETYDDNIEEGKVVRTDPSANTPAKQGSNVTIFVSKGEKIKKIAVPGFVNMTEADAKDLANSLGLTLKIQREENDTIKKDYVFWQSIKEGTEVNPQDVISIKVSLGQPEDVTYTGELSITAEDAGIDEESEPVNVQLVLTQGSTNKSTIMNKKCSYTDFPLNLTVTGFYEGSGTVRMYIDGSPVPGSWPVKFVAKGK